MSQIINQKRSLCNIIEIQNKISFRKKHIDIKQYKNTENGFILKNYFNYGYKSGIHYEDLTEEIKVYLPRIVKRVFERRKDFVRDFFVYLDTHEIIDLRDRENKVIYNLSEYLMEGEELVDIYSFSGPLFFLTNFGRILYRTRKLLQSFTMGDYYFEVLKDKNKKTIIVDRWGPVNFGLTYFYFTTQDGILYKIDKDAILFTIKRVTEVKDKITKIKILDSKGVCGFKTFKGDWLIYNKSNVKTQSFLQKRNYTKLNIKDIIIKKSQMLVNDSFNCIDIFFEFGCLYFLMDDFIVYYSNDNNFERFDIVNFFKERNITFLGGDTFNSFGSLEFKFAPNSTGFIVWWEKTEIITKEFISFPLKVKSNLNELNFVDISIQFH